MLFAHSNVQFGSYEPRNQLVYGIKFPVRFRPLPERPSLVWLERSVATMTTAVHNVDQRSPVVSIEHAALPCVVECEQYGPGHAKFVADTSSVIWACGKLLPQHLCEHPDEVCGKRCCELGAGIGLAGATAFALGATDVLLTDLRFDAPRPCNFNISPSMCHLRSSQSHTLGSSRL